MSDAAADRADRIAWLIALEIRRILVSLEDRREFLVMVWSRYRAREPLLDTLHSRYNTLGFDLLVTLPRDTVKALEVFYGRVDELRLYISYTEDMPTTLGDVLDEHIESLWEAGMATLRALDVDGLELPTDPHT